MTQLLTPQKAAELLKELQYAKAEMGQLSIRDEYFKQALEQLLALQDICHEAYQVIGSLSTITEGKVDDMKIEHILDNLSELKILHHDVLPFPIYDKVTK